MKIKKLLEGVDVVETSLAAQDIDVARLSCHSKDINGDAIFVAVRGPKQDGHRYINDAIVRRAQAIVFDDPSFFPSQNTTIPFVLVKNSKSALKQMADNFFDHPYKKVDVIGITGTNGKTTISYLVRSVCQAAGISCGVIGTIGYKVEEENISLANTTPGTLELHAIMRRMVDAGNRYVAMEVSSHALDQERVEGLNFKAAIFTNLTQDHLDYHKTMEDYFLAKQKLFKDFSNPQTCCVINGDDSFGARLIKSLKGKVLSYGFSNQSDIFVVSYELKGKGSHAVIKTSQGELTFDTPLVGKHNLYNILASIGFAVSQGITLGDIKKGIESVVCVPGRLERIESAQGFSVFVDYAHTDDALKNVLESLRAIIHNARIITVFGCGGDRDKGKRFKMGRVVSALSDYCFVTSDNPRSEDPASIISSIVGGMEKENFEIELDRYHAIRKALKIARRGDFVLVAGKGHETYQIIKDKTYPFDDKAVVGKILSEMSA